MDPISNSSIGEVYPLMNPISMWLGDCVPESQTKQIENYESGNYDLNHYKIRIPFERSDLFKHNVIS